MKEKANHDHAYFQRKASAINILTLLANFQGEGEHGWEGRNAKNAHLHGGAVSILTLQQCYIDIHVYVDICICESIIKKNWQGNFSY